MVSRSYGRLAVGAEPSCESFTRSLKNEATDVGSPRVRSESGGVSGTRCVSCNHWLPFETLPIVGECDNPASKNFGKAAFADRISADCYEPRSLEGLDFMWCETHRQTIYSAERPEHRGCRLFAGSVVLPVEEELELTLAGD